jgi:hypothetical protein
MSLSSLIWSVAELLRGDYKQSDYGKVILPFTVLRRLDCVLEPIKKGVLAGLVGLSLASALFLVFEKHSRQSTGVPRTGTNWTVVGRPHSAQIVVVRALGFSGVLARLALQDRQTFGAFRKCFSWKKYCSSAVKEK